MGGAAEAAMDFSEFHFTKGVDENMQQQQTLHIPGKCFFHNCVLGGETL
jgi:hypothetical protein